GRARLKALFGARALPVLVPPWNRLSDDCLPMLRDCSIVAVSVMSSSHEPVLPAGLARLDVHLDLVAWRGDRGFIGEAAALGLLLALLQARPLGVAAAAPPIGILTHHLVMDEPTAAFLERLIQTTRAHKAAHWAAVSELLQ